MLKDGLENAATLYGAVVIDGDPDIFSLASQKKAEDFSVAMRRLGYDTVIEYRVRATRRRPSR